MPASENDFGNPEEKEEIRGDEPGILRKIEMMSRRIEEIAKGRLQNEEVEMTSRHLFTHRIMQEPLPQGFRVPQLELYNEEDDPIDHLQKFNCSMTLHGISDAIMCQAFPLTLERVARMWYSNLRPSSIDSFTQLSRMFLAYFASSRRQRQTFMGLMEIKQGSGESIRDYLTRFNTAAIRVADLDQSMAVITVTYGMYPSRLAYSLWKSPPFTLHDLMKKANKYI